jgi:hypothetical protein
MEHRTHRVRHISRRRTLEVQEKWHVTPRMLRMVLGGEDFEDFTTPSADDHIKLYVPSKAGDLAARDFTPRHFDAEAKKLTIDIALHSAGPAIRWAEQGPTQAIGMRGNGECHLCVAFNSSGVNSRSRFCAAKPPKAIAMRVSAWLRSLNPAGKYRLPTNPLAPAPTKFANAIRLRSESDLSRKVNANA